MKIDPATTLEQFRDEMQHRVVKYPLNSRPVKEALRFAKKHEDPAFYRIASDKVHAQRQFQRELYGPGRLERLNDFISLGSLREVVITLLLVSAGVMSLEVGKRLMARPDEKLDEHMDIDELASRLGIAFDASGDAGMLFEAASPSDKPSSSSASPTTRRSAKPTGKLGDDDVERIAEAVMRRLSQLDALQRLETPGGDAKDASAVGTSAADGQVAAVSDR